MCLGVDHERTQKAGLIVTLGPRPKQEKHQELGAPNIAQGGPLRIFQLSIVQSLPGLGHLHAIFLPCVEVQGQCLESEENSSDPRQASIPPLQLHS